MCLGAGRMLAGSAEGPPVGLRALPCDFYHAACTAALWVANVDVMSRLLFASVHDTLLELLGDGKYLGAKPGIIATRHTWPQTLLLHPPTTVW